MIIFRFVVIILLIFGEEDFSLVCVYELDGNKKRKLKDIIRVNSIVDLWMFMKNEFIFLGIK